MNLIHDFKNYIICFFESWHAECLSPSARWNLVLIAGFLLGKIIMILFGLLAILTMTHSAMRIAMPCLMYSFIFPKFEL